MRTEVKGAEAHGADGQLLHRRELRRVVRGHAVVLEAVEQRGLAGVVEPEEEDLRVLVGQALQISYLLWRIARLVVIPPNQSRPNALPVRFRDRYGTET